MKGTGKPWDHDGRSRQARGYDRKHDRIRAELKRKVVLCEECTRQGRTAIGSIADHHHCLVGWAGFNISCQGPSSSNPTLDEDLAHTPTRGPRHHIGVPWSPLVCSMDNSLVREATWNHTLKLSFASKGWQTWNILHSASARSY